MSRSPGNIVATAWSLVLVGIGLYVVGILLASVWWVLVITALSLLGICAGAWWLWRRW